MEINQDEYEKVLKFINNESFKVEVFNGDGWVEAITNFDKPEEALILIKKSDDYRIVKTFNLWDLGI